MKNPVELIAALLITAVLAFTLGGGGGAYLAWKYTSARHAAALATIEKNQAEADRKARVQEAERLRLARKRGDKLQADLAKTESTLNAKSLELSYALRKTTTGRACLSADTVRLLNDPAHSTDAARGVPAPAERPADPDGAVATDTDVAGWAANARTQYDICRARLDKLIDFESPQGGAMSKDDVATLSLLLAGANFVLTWAVALYMYLTNKNKATNARIDALEARVTESILKHENQLTKLESGPTHQDLGQWHEKTNQMNTGLAQLTGTVIAMSRQLNSIDDYLRNKVS